MRQEYRHTNTKSAAKKPLTTSWGDVADWYDDYLEKTADSYQERVIAPNLLRVLALKKGDRLLDIGCGQGFFTRKFADAGAVVTGADISPELIARARELSPSLAFHVAPAQKLSFTKEKSFDFAVSVLAIQNMRDLQKVFAETARVLTQHGRFILVMNHPAFRIPQRSNWGWDESTKTQYRRLDGYLSESTVPILAHPGAKKSEVTLSYHHSLQDIFKALNRAGFAVTRLEEWISHKKSGKGARQAAEDTARKEFPLFLMLEMRKGSVA